MLEKMETIENLLRQLNAKIDNFVGYEELSERERTELRRIRKEVRSGEVVSLDEAF